MGLNIFFPSKKNRRLTTIPLSLTTGRMFKDSLKDSAFVSYLSTSVRLILFLNIFTEKLSPGLKSVPERIFDERVSV